MSEAPAGGRLQVLWGGIPARDRRFYGVVAVCCLLGLVAGPLWAALDRQVRVSARFWAGGVSATSGPGWGGAGSDTDPWGRPVLYARLGEVQVTSAYSTGPNGVDEGGLGDDVPILSHRDPRLVAYMLLPWVVVALTLTSALCWELVRFLQRPALTTRTEVWASALAALPVGGAAAGLVLLALRWGWLPEGLRAALEGRLLIPLEVSLAAWSVAAAFGAILWVRLRREKAGEGE